MRSLDEISALVEQKGAEQPASACAAELLALGEEVIEHWLDAKDLVPTEAQREGFRLLALHHQGAKLEPSFNACRETCRELVFHYNLISIEPDHVETNQRLDSMRSVARHLFYFVAGKMQNEKLGEFCCSSRPLRVADVS